MTYVEFVEMVKGYNIRKKNERNSYLFISWHTALFNRQKELPEYESLLIDPYEKEEKPQTADQMANIARMLNAAFGGTEVMDGHTDS